MLETFDNTPVISTIRCKIIYHSSTKIFHITVPAVVNTVLMLIEQDPNKATTNKQGSYAVDES